MNQIEKMFKEYVRGFVAGQNSVIEKIEDKIQELEEMKLSKKDKVSNAMRNYAILILKDFFEEDKE